MDALPALQGLRHGLIIAFGQPSGQQFAPILRHFLGGLVVLTHRYRLSGGWIGRYSAISRTFCQLPAISLSVAINCATNSQ